MTASPPCIQPPLSDLELELWLTYSVIDADYDRIKAHLDGCVSCAQRLEEAIALEAEFKQLAPPPILQSAAHQPPANTQRWLLFSLVAALFIGFIMPRPSPSPAPERYRLKGSPIVLEVFVDDGQAVRPSAPGRSVSEGDRLGFRYTASHPGHLMIVGVDGAAQPYLCFPQQTDGRSVAVRANADPVTVPEAIRLDGQLGEEHIVALLCDAPIVFSEIKAGLTRAWSANGILSLIRPDCAQHEVRLVKEVSR